MLNIKISFKYVFFICLLAQLILFLFLVIYYIANSNIILKRIKEHKKRIAVVFRDSNIEYLNKKIKLIAEDSLIILKVFDQDDNSNPPNNSDKKCGDENPYKSWYLGEGIKELKQGCFMNLDDENNKEIITKIDRAKKIMEYLFLKYYSWKSKIYVYVEFLNFSFGKGEFYKYPNNYFNKLVDTNNAKQDCSKIADPKNNYDPRCRPSYSKALNSQNKITITEPYTLADGQYGSDLCFKSLKNLQNPELPEYIMCLGFNFYDYDLGFNNFSLDSDEMLVYIVYIDSTTTERIKTVYNSKYIHSTLRCQVKIDYCDPISLFDVYFKDELDELYKRLNEAYPDDKNSVEKNFKDQYDYLGKEFKGHILKNILELADYKNATRALEITPETVSGELESLYSFQYNAEISISQNFDFHINEKSDGETVMVFPLISGFDYDENYKLKRTNNHNYFIIVRSKVTSKEATKSKFIVTILVEFTLYLFYLILFNWLIWTVFVIVDEYILEGLMFPLKKIKGFYMLIIKMLINNTLQPKEDLILSKKNSKNKKVTVSCATDLHQCIIRKISEISQIERHLEISECLTTLKAIIIIIKFKKNTINYKTHNTNNSSITSFFEALQYLSESFYSKYTNKEGIDYKLAKLIVESSFHSMINAFKKGKEGATKSAISSFYDAIKRSIKRARNEIESVTRGLSLDIYSHEYRMDLYYLSILEENISYLYSVLQVDLIDKQIVDYYQNLELDNEAEEKKLLSTLKKNEILKQKNKLTKQKTLTLKDLVTKLYEDDISDEIKGEIFYIVKELEYTLELNLTNESEGKMYIEMPNRSEEIFEYLKLVTLRLCLSKYYIYIDEDQKGLIEFENALQAINAFSKKIEHSMPHRSHYNQTEYVMLIVNTIIFEKFLFIVSLICKKYSQYKNEVFVNLNVLDLSPIYTKSLRSIITVKLSQYLHYIRKKLLQGSSSNLEEYKLLVSDDYYIDIQRCCYIINSMASSSSTLKNFLFILDLQNNYLKDNFFKEIIKKTIIKQSTTQFYFCAYDSKLYVMNCKKEDIEEETKEYDKKYILSIEDYIKKDQPSNDQEEEENTNKRRFQKIFEFLSSYKRKKERKEKPNRTDKALYHGVLFGMKKLAKYKMFQHIQTAKKFRNVNFVVVLTNVKSIFNNSEASRKLIRNLVYEKNMSVFFIINENDEISEFQVKEKIRTYFDFARKELVDGHVIVMRTFSLLKLIFCAMFSMKFDKFNWDKIRDYLISENKVSKK